MQSLARDGFSKAQVILALHYPHRRIDFRYELLDRNGYKKADLKNVLSGEVSHNALAQIKRTARFTLKDDGTIDFLNDRIKPYVRVYVPEGRKFSQFSAFYSQQFAPLIHEASESRQSGWVEFPQGEFLLSSPTRKEENGVVIREVEAFDGLVILRDDKFTERYTIPAGTNYRQAVIDILTSAGITRHNIQNTTKTLPTDVEFEPGTEKLDAINQLLQAINYDSLHVDVNGYFTAQEYRTPSQRAAEYSYVTDSSSVTYGGMSEELDLFNVPNKWVAVVSNAEQVLVSTYENNNVNSPTSTVNRGRTIVDYREVNDIADQTSLDAYVHRIAFEASQVYGKITFETAIMPHHDYFDVLNVDFKDLGIKGKYAETSWSMPLTVGGRMKHTVRKVVSI
jgi:hypothetical protein